MNTKLCRRAAALATAVASLVLMATPASAVTTHGATTTGGTMEFLTSTGTTGITNSDIPLAGTVGTDCGSTLSVAEDGATGSFDIVQFSSAARFSIGTGYYVAVTTRQSSTAGTFSAGVILSETITLRVDIFPAANQTSTSTSCTPTATRICRYTLTLHLNGTYTGWTASSDLQLTGTANVSAFACQVPLSEYNGGTVDIAAWDIHLTT